MTNQFRTYIVAAAVLMAASILSVKISQDTDISRDTILQENKGGEDEHKSPGEEEMVRKSGAEADFSLDNGNLENFPVTGDKETDILERTAGRCRKFLEHLQTPKMGAGYTPSVSSLNLAYLFSQPESTSGLETLVFQEIQRGLCLLNPVHHTYSMGGELFEKLNRKEQEWMYRIYHDLSQLPYRTSIHLQLTDGDGQEDGSYTNSQEILSLASVYAYYHAWDDYAATERYALKLWELSHQYDISVGSVYYCDGCEEERSGDTEKSSEGEDPAENEISAQKRPMDLSDENQAMTMPSGPAADPAVQADGAVKREESHTSIPDSEETGGETAGNENSGNDEAAGNTAKTENTGLTDAENMNCQQIPDSGQEMAQQALGGQETGTGAGENFSGCPGHVDVTVTVRICGLDEKNSLFSLAQDIRETETAENGGTEKDVYSAMAETPSWPGWNDDTMKAACILADQDWEAQYGFARSAMSFGKTLTRQEYETYMRLLPEELSSERKSLIAFALDSVGKVPYYYGGKPARPGFDGNHFFSMASPDTMGRTLKGLDCSGWINWVYWSVLGSPITSAGTSSLAESGRAVTKEELKPGDIAVTSGDDAHVVLFLGWDEATGEMICIHESAGNTNNVTVSCTDRDWTDYRSLME